jgi:hypothetical protein
MSQTETIRGKLKHITRPDGQNLNVACRNLFAEQGDGKLEDYYEDFVEKAREQLEGYVICNDELYEIVDYNDLSADDVFEASKNEDGTIDFLVQYYNGGCGFSEALEYALKNMKEK